MHPKIEAKIGEFQTMIEKLKAMESIVNDCEDAANLFSDIIFSWHIAGDTVVIHVQMDQLSDVGPLLKHLSEKGYNRLGDMVNHAEWKEVCWRFKENICLDGYFTEDSKCSFVQVGVKEEPVYELKCE